MTIGIENPTETSVGTGSLKDFPFAFTVFKDEDIVAIVEDRVDQILGVDFTVDIPIPGSPGGTVSFTIAPENSKKVVIRRRVKQKQEEVFDPNADFPAKTNEVALDRLAAMIQDQQLDLTQKVGVGDLAPSNFDATLPITADEFIKVKSDGLGYEGSILPTTNQTNIASNVTAIGVNAGVISGHIGNAGNPHAVTAAQVGAAVAQWNANKVLGVIVNDTNKADGRVLVFRTGTGEFGYEDQAGAGGGESNTASNEGAGGIGLFKQKTVANLEFRNINNGDGIAVTLDAPNNEVDIEVDISSLTEDLTPDLANDFLMTFDASAGVIKKVKANTVGGVGGTGEVKELGNLSIEMGSGGATGLTASIYTPSGVDALVTGLYFQLTAIAGSGIVPAISAGQNAATHNDVFINQPLQNIKAVSKVFNGAGFGASHLIEDGNDFKVNISLLAGFTTYTVTARLFGKEL